MNYSEVKRLVKLVESSDIHDLEYEEKDGARIRIRKADPAPVASVAAPASYVMESPAAQAPAAATAPAASEPQPEQAPQAIDAGANYHEVKSPMVGTFYRAPAPDAEAYVKVGDKVTNGQVLCIVEAMKLMNEIESDAAGRIVDVKVENGQPVEFGQVLFLIDPHG